MSSKPQIYDLALNVDNKDKENLITKGDLSWVLGTGNRDQHDKLVAALPVPAGIVDATIADDAFRVRTGPKNKRRFDGRVIRFDSFIAPAVRLNAAGMEHHHLTAKVFVNMGMIPGIGWTEVDLTIDTSYRALLNMIRWMNLNKIPSMSALREPHFRLFKDQLLAGGLEGLFPILPNLTVYLERVADGREAFPTYRIGGKEYVSWLALANKFGLTHPKMFSDAARDKILDGIEKLCPSLLRGQRLATDAALLDEDGEESRLTGRRVAEILLPWERLHDLKPWLQHDPIGYRAFTPLVKRFELAEKIGIETGRTKDIPHEVLGYLLDRALRWLDYSDQIKEPYFKIRSLVRSSEFEVLDSRQRHASVSAILASEIKKINALPEATGAPWPMVSFYSDKEKTFGSKKVGLTFREVLTRLLPGACILIIALFSARRRIEINSLRHACVVNDGVPWLLAWIGKGTQEVDRIPIPECVSKAVEILEWLSEDARLQSGDDWLFMFRDLYFDGRIVSVSLADALNDFSQFVGTSQFPDGSGLKIALHQLRRSWALIHFYRFRMPSLMAVSWFLRHYNFEDTLRYLTKPELGAYQRLLEKGDASEELSKAANEIKKEAKFHAATYKRVAEKFLVDVLVAAQCGREPVSGTAGDAMMIDLEHYITALTGRIEVTNNVPKEPIPRMDEMIRRFVKVSKITLIPNAFGTSSCLCGSDPHRLELANCIKRKKERDGAHSIVGLTEPDPENAEPTECVGCYNGVQLPENEKYMNDYVSQQERMARETKSEILSSAAIKRAQKVNFYKQKYYGNSECQADGRKKPK